MDSFEPKKLALIRIEQILRTYSDYDHPLTQEDIAGYLESEYGIVIERKAVSRNLSLLKEAGVEIGSRRAGCYLEHRDFEDAELHMLIDGVLSSRYITAKHSKDLIDRLCGLSNRYFRASVRHVRSVGDRSKTDNPTLFYHIELIDSAIEQGHQIHYTYIRLSATGDGTKVAVSLKASPNAMEHRATQYIDHVEVTAPEHLRKRIQTVLENAAAKYRK